MGTTPDDLLKTDAEAGSLRLAPILTIFLVIFGLIGFVLFWSSFAINDKEYRSFLLNEEIMMVKGEVMSFHLWIEEYLLGHTESEFEREFLKVDNARRGLEIIINGGVSHDGLSLSPIADDGLRQMASGILLDVEKLGVIVRGLFSGGLKTVASDPIYIEIDELAEGILEKSEELEDRFHHEISDGHTRSVLFIQGLTSLWLIFMIVSAVGTYVVERRRKVAETEKVKTIGELKEALSNVKTLSGLLPICAYCAKIRDDKGYWKKVESYMHEHLDAEFSHGICDECAKEMLRKHEEHKGD